MICVYTRGEGEEEKGMNGKNSPVTPWSVGPAETYWEEAAGKPISKPTRSKVHQSRGAEMCKTCSQLEFVMSYW